MSSRRLRRAKPKAAPRAPAGFASLPEPALRNIARLLEAQAAGSPLWDKQDLLRTAATLALVGNRTATSLAHLVFKLLSPRYGQRMPGGVTADSPLAHLQLAAQTWGLSMSGRTKQDVYRNLLDHVEDSERDAQGRPPKHCLVSAATRRELSGWGQKRVTIAKAKEVFGLDRYDLIGLDMEERKMGAFYTQTFSLKEIKERAIELLPTRTPEQQAALLNGRRRRDEEAASAAAAAAAAAKKGAVCAVLQQHGYPPARVEALLSQPGAFRLWEDGYSESSLPAEEAALALERWFFLVQGPGQPHFMQALAANANWEPPGSSSTAVTAAADAAHARRMRAMETALPEWLATQRNLMFILGNPEVPRSMLPELQRMWAEREQPAQQPAQIAQPQSQPARQAQQDQHEQGQRSAKPQGKPQQGQKQGLKQGQKRKPKQQGGPAEKR